MEIKPILFNKEMVRAILEGRKTQTRRLIRCNSFDVYKMSCFRGLWHEKYDPQNPPPFLVEAYARSWKRTPCNTGDILWVRETWSTHYDGIHDDLQFCYKADDIDLKAECLPGENNRWYPPIHMPKEAARIFLQVKDVRVEKLQDMSEEDAMAEGFADFPAGTDGPLERFCTLWDTTIKRDDLREYGYHANPWVWVIEFERCEKPEGWCE